MSRRAARGRTGGSWGEEFSADVVDGKFAGRRDFKKGEQDCGNKACWTVWEGTIKDDGTFKMMVRESDWSRVSSDTERWTFSGKFTTPDSGTVKITQFPRD